MLVVVYISSGSDTVLLDLSWIISDTFGQMR